MTKLKTNSNLHILLNVYNILYKTFGKQYWWPGNSAFEVIVGAILTQNTNWKNVEKAIVNLKLKNYLTIQSINNISLESLSGLIKPAGYYNIKAIRLKNFVDYIVCNYNGNLNLLLQNNIQGLRSKLLSINGIGPETADSIILYAAKKPIFVVDTYTKRFIVRHNILKKDASYQDIQNIFMNNLPHKTKLFNEFHALFVSLGKEFCKKKPDCAHCPLKNLSY